MYRVKDKQLKNGVSECFVGGQLRLREISMRQKAAGFRRRMAAVDAGGCLATTL